MKICRFICILKTFRFSENLTHLFFLLSRHKFSSIALATLENFNAEKRKKIKIQKPKCLEYIVVVLLCSNLMQSQSVFGKWKTIDDRTGNPKGIINVYKKDGMLYGEIDKVLEPGREDSVCIKCKGDLKNTPIVGMTIIKAGKMNDDNEWKGKFLFDPEQGMTFRFKIWLNPDNSDELKVRGYLAFLFRTQTWLRVDG